MQAQSAVLTPGIQQPVSIAELLKDKSLDDASALTAQVFTLLKELIVTVKLYPGQLISEKEVAETLKASKTPVREAMIRLQGIGLVEIVPKSGTYVTTIQITRYIEALLSLPPVSTRRGNGLTGNSANGRSPQPLITIRSKSWFRNR